MKNGRYNLGSISFYHVLQVYLTLETIKGMYNSEKAIYKL